MPQPPDENAVKKAGALETSQPKPLRLWPGVVIVALQWVSRFVVPVVMPEAVPFAVMAGLAGGLLVVLWWMFFSRARWSERLGAVVVMAVAMVATSRLVHESIATGMMGLMFPVYVIPVLSLAFVLWAAVFRRFADGPRRVAMVAIILFACAGWTLVRTGGFTSDLEHEFAWRWSATPEDRLLAQGDDQPKAPVTAPSAAEAGAEWPGFRGAARDGVIHGVKIETNWLSSPPVELWRRPVGPGWSSFAASGNLFYTQEQRGDEEVVTCYQLATGEPTWRHADATRFWESNAGAGPRGTPTLHQGTVLAFGATGILNALDARDGFVVWRRNAAADNDTKIPEWGFASSPLVTADLAIVAVSGTLAAYDLATGEPRWKGPTDGGCYSSPHLLEINGVTQIVLSSGAGTTSVAPADGKVLWRHAWPGFGIVQPARIANGDILISTGDHIGVRCIAVAPGPGGWTTEERWTSNRLKPYFNDFVAHRSHVYGFDNGILGCIDIMNGDRAWKGGRFGRGQLVLLAAQDVLLVLSEQGELALVAADPGEFRELARFPAIKGKTWNHPILAGDVLLVRNDREMAAFRLNLVGLK